MTMPSVRPRVLLVDDDPSRSAILAAGLRDAGAFALVDPGRRRVRRAHLPHAVLSCGPTSTEDDPVLRGAVHLRLRGLSGHFDEWPMDWENLVASATIAAARQTVAAERHGPPEGASVSASWYALRNLSLRPGCWLAELTGARGTVLQLHRGRVYAAHRSIALAALRDVAEATLTAAPIDAPTLDDVGSLRALAVDVDEARSGIRPVSRRFESTRPPALERRSG